jgi:hypothetical protein
MIFVLLYKIRLMEALRFSSVFVATSIVAARIVATAAAQ